MNKWEKKWNEILVTRGHWPRCSDLGVPSGIAGYQWPHYDTYENKREIRRQSIKLSQGKPTQINVLFYQAFIDIPKLTSIDLGKSTSLHTMKSQGRSQDFPLGGANLEKGPWGHMGTWIQGQKIGPISNFYELGTFVLWNFLTKVWAFLSTKPSLNGICTGAGAGKHNVLQSACTDIEGVKTVRPNKCWKLVGVTWIVPPLAKVK